jgi:hypothetical protein
VILFAKSASFFAFPESNDLHDRAERLEGLAGLRVLVGAEETLPWVVDHVVSLGGVAG